MEGELWKARTSGEAIEAGVRVVVESVKGLTLRVRREDEDADSEPGDK